MELEIHRLAEREMAATVDWYDERGPRLARDFLDDVHIGFDSILETPAAWPEWPVSPTALGIRRFVLQTFPFSIAYVIRGNCVFVVAVAHHRRSPRYWLSRISES